jgi:hypothetical protein
VECQDALYFTQMSNEHGDAESIDGVDCAFKCLALIDASALFSEQTAALQRRIDS